MFGCKICNYQTLKECNFSRHLNSDIHRNAVRFLSVDISLTEGRDCDERGNFIPSVEDINEREQNLDNDDLDQPDQLDASDEEKEELLNTECGPGDQFFPFSSKLHMLLYIFKNSPTHPVVRHECILCKWIT